MNYKGTTRKQSELDIKLIEGVLIPITQYLKLCILNNIYIYNIQIFWSSAASMSAQKNWQTEFNAMPSFVFNQSIMYVWSCTLQGSVLWDAITIHNVYKGYIPVLWICLEWREASSWQASWFSWQSERKRNRTNIQLISQIGLWPKRYLMNGT